MTWKKLDHERWIPQGGTLVGNPSGPPPDHKLLIIFSKSVQENRMQVQVR